MSASRRTAWTLVVLVVGTTTWIAGVGCKTTPEASPSATAPESEPEVGDVDRETGEGEDAAAGAPRLCHTGGYDCKDGVPCCGGGVCSASGVCEPPDGATCKRFGDDCSSFPCCQGTTCTKLAVGSRCTLPTGCTKSGAACADDGNCCGGLTCQAGTCKPTPRVGKCKVYGERCGAVDCCPSDMGCSNRRCCMVADFAKTTCLSNDDCCTGLCKGGLCDVSPAGGACEYYDDCGGDDSGRVCEQRVCCGEERAICTRPSDCCSGACVSGRCGCLPKGSSSASSASCCSKLLAGGVCQ